MKQAASKPASLATCFVPVSCLAYTSTLKMEATYSSEMSVDFQQTTQPYNPEDRTLHIHRCENLKSYTGQGSLRPDRNFNQAPPEYKSQALLLSQHAQFSG
jgi:hypothetical protein